MQRRYFDLSQLIENGMSYFPGDPEPMVQPSAQAMPPWQVSELKIGSHTGTHIDAACHYIPGARTIESYDPGRFILPGIVIPLLNLPDDQPIPAQVLEAGLANLPEGGAVLIRTDWDQYWKTERYERHPYLTAGATQALRNAGITLLGIDALNVDSTVQGTSHVHESLLTEDILIVENLRGLGQLESLKPYQFSFLPLPISGSDGSPVRAVAWEN
jgi:kynurenine formamidase